jgi:hypothetical protein
MRKGEVVLWRISHCFYRQEAGRQPLSVRPRGARLAAGEWRPAPLLRAAWEAPRRPERLVRSDFPG